MFPPSPVVRGPRSCGRRRQADLPIWLACIVALLGAEAAFHQGHAQAGFTIPKGTDIVRIYHKVDRNIRFTVHGHFDTTFMVQLHALGDSLSETDSTSFGRYPTERWMERHYAREAYEALQGGKDSLTPWDGTRIEKGDYELTLSHTVLPEITIARSTSFYIALNPLIYLWVEEETGSDSGTDLKVIKEEKLEELVRPRTVHVKSWSGAQRQRPERGTGFILNIYGHVVTAAHVVTDSASEMSHDTILVFLRNPNERAGQHNSMRSDQHRPVHYRIIGSPFPEPDEESSQELRDQLVVLAPVDPRDIDLDSLDLRGLELVRWTKETDGSLVLLPDPPDDEFWIAGKPGEQEPFDMKPGSSTPTATRVVMRGDGFSRGSRRRYIRYGVGIPPKWSGGPVFDNFGRVWGFHIGDVGVEEAGHWASDVVVQYGLWEEDGTLAQVLMGRTNEKQNATARQ